MMLSTVTANAALAAGVGLSFESIGGAAIAGLGAALAAAMAGIGSALLAGSQEMARARSWHARQYATASAGPAQA